MLKKIFWIFIAALIIYIPIGSAQISGGINNNLWKVTNNVLSPVVSSWTVLFPSTATSTFTGNLQVNGTLTVASSSNIYYGWVKPILWSVGTAPLAATANQWQCQEFELPVQKQVVGINYTQGISINGNVAGAIFRSSGNPDLFNGAILEASIGSTPVSATSTTISTMTLSLATTTIPAGAHFACLQWSAATTGFVRQAGGAIDARSGIAVNTNQMFSYSTTSFATFYNNFSGTIANTNNNQPSIQVQFIQ